jgi:CoA:oxalate CoA-transferase
VRNLHEVLTDEQLLARDMVHTLQHSVAGPVSVLGIPIKMSETPGAVRLPPPALGEHTEQVLTTDLGVPASEMPALRAAGIV